MLVDSFLRNHDYLRISLTEKCSMRCFYCMPAEGVSLADPSTIMKKDEVLALARIFVEQGIRKIRLTGGEPLVCKDAAEIILALSKLPVELAITTNGLLVDKFVKVFKNAKLRHVNISVDSLNESKFNMITKRNHYKKVQKNIRLLLKEDFHVQVNTVVIRGINDEEIIDFIEWTRLAPMHIRFIEFMPFDGNRWNWGKVVGYQEILERIQNVYKIYKLKDKPNSTSKGYFINGFEGTFAVISPVTEPFCSSCNRFRLTADGKLKNCLFGKSELDLLTPLREGQEILPYIFKSLIEKKEVCGGLGEFKNTKTVLKSITDRCMARIGG